MCCTWLTENTGCKNDAKTSPSGHHPTSLSGYIFATDNMVNFGLLVAEIVSGVRGTPTTFNGFCVLAALLHGSQVVSVSQTLRRWTEGATYVRQGDHHVGHWPTFLVLLLLHPQKGCKVLHWPCLYACISESTHPNFTKFSVHIIRGCGLVLPPEHIV